MELMCQKVNIPGISIGDQPQPTTLGTTIPVATQSIQFELLNVENIANDYDHNLNYQDWHHQANLLIYDGFNDSPPTTFKFYHIIPVSLSGFMFQSDSADALVQKATCKFKYSHYTINPDAPSNLKNTA
jgi:hypothetical protein